MTDAPNESDFSYSEKPREFTVTFDVQGAVRRTVYANSIEDARDKAGAMLEDESEEWVIDEADSVRISYVGKSPKMFRVTRGGKPMQVSRLASGDVPREPDERGF